MAGREPPQIAGKMISDPRCTPADIEAVIDLAVQKDPTLSDKHIAALRKLFDGPRHPRTHERIFNGIPLGCSIDKARGNLYTLRWVFGPNKDFMDIDFNKDIDTYTSALGSYLNAEDPDLSAFKKRGGKLIMYSGSADSRVPCHATLDYYDRVIEHLASYEKVREFFNYYIIPGMSHGASPGINNLPDFLDMIVAWRENGIAPDAIMGRRIVDGEVKTEIPIYPYPMKTTWNRDSGFKAMEGAFGGVERIASRFSPAPAP